MFEKMAAHHKIVRVLVVLTAALLTIFFIYASYYSNLFMVPTRMHSAAIITQMSEETSRFRGDNNEIVIVDRQNSEKLNSDTDMNSSHVDVLQLYPSAPSVVFQKSTNATRNSTVAVSIPVGAVSIGNTTKPTNTTSASPSPISASPVLDAVSSGNESAISVVSHPSAATSVRGGPIDPLKGVRTGNLYECGHLDDTNTSLCPDEGDELKLLIIITSAPTHRDARLAIRQTWGHFGVRRDVAIAFILGRTTNPSLEDLISAENYIYGDLIRGRFIDSYNNLTLKTVSALEWIDRNCPHVNYVLKTDDDMFINVPKLFSFIEKHQKDKRTIFGRLAKKWKPIRNKKSKYYVSTGQFASTIFPQFTTGPAYLMTADIIHDLYSKALDETYLKLEDVFTTGIVAQLLNIKRVHVKEFLNRRIAFNTCNIRKAISVHMVKSHEQFDLWKKLLDMTSKCK